MIPSCLWTRRRLLGSAFSATGGLLVAGEKPARALKTVSIFHTTDLHGHIMPTRTYQGVGAVGGLARCVTQIRQWKRESPHHLLVDIGDLYQGTPVGLASKGEIMTGLLNRLGYDAWVIGNHDLDWGRQAIEANLQASASPVLTGNLKVDGKATAEAEGPWAKVKPWVIKEVNGLRIALIGLTTPGMPMWLAPETLGGIAVSDPVSELQRIMADVREAKPNAVVLLGHMGWKFQDDSDNPVRAMLQATRGVDVYIGGHSHQDQPSWMLHGTLCTQANYFGIHCGRVDLHFHADTGKLFDSRAFTVMMDDRFAPDAEVVQIAAPEEAKADAEMARVLCEVKSVIPGKGRDGGLVGLICTALAATLEKAGQPVDGVFHGSFGTGDIEPGPFTVADAWRLLPYENLLVTVELNSGEMLRLAEENAAIKSSDRILWGFEIEKDPRGKVVKFLHQGKPVEGTEKRYKIAINSYDSQSAGGRMPGLQAMMQSPAVRRKLTDIDTRSALIGYLADVKTLPSG